MSAEEEEETPPIRLYLYPAKHPSVHRVNKSVRYQVGILAGKLTPKQPMIRTPNTWLSPEVAPWKSSRHRLRKKADNIEIHSC